MKVCAVPDCCKASIKKGYCQSHYKRWWRHGDPLAGRGPRTASGEPQRYVHEVAMKSLGADCLVWPYGCYPGGYAKITIDGKDMTASRYVCELTHGSAPTSEHESAHSCGNRSCVNPGHVSWKTPMENNADKLLHGTHNRGERHNLAKLTESDVHAIRCVEGLVSNRNIADRYGVSATAISRIYTGQNWGWLEPQGASL